MSTDKCCWVTKAKIVLNSKDMACFHKYFTLYWGQEMVKWLRALKEADFVMFEKHFAGFSYSIVLSILLRRDSNLYV